jgi:Ca2+-binding RTX toxin-like protein
MSLIVGTAGDDVLSATSLNNEFDVKQGGKDIVYGNAGVDNFYFGTTLTKSDRIYGDSGVDTLYLQGDYSFGLKFANGTMRDVEIIELASGFSYDITIAALTVGSGSTLTLDATNLSFDDHVRFNGAAGANGEELTMLGGAGADTLLGGYSADTFDGGGGADFLDGNANSLSALTTDTFVYAAASDSTGLIHDTVEGFNAELDLFDLWTAVSGVDEAVAGGKLSKNFDANLAKAIGADELSAGHAVLFNPDEGKFAGKTFLVIDTNGTAGYQAGQDLVIELVNGLNLASLNADVFI